MPDHFFVIGAQRSATTYLCHMLDQHPDITMARPLRPEPKYFLREPYHFDIAAYRKEFFPGAVTHWLGEKSTSYIEHPRAAKRIAAALPDARILCLLRDPVERAISNYRFSVANGLESLSLQEALDIEDTRVAGSTTGGPSVSPFAYVGRGHYARFLDNWQLHFPREHIFLLTTEQTVGGDASLRTLFSRLGIRVDVPLKGLGQAVNDSYKLADDVPHAVRKRLSDQFAASNRDLALRYDVNVDHWQ